jgi:hypothetical protein
MERVGVTSQQAICLPSDKHKSPSCVEENRLEGICKYESIRHPSDQRFSR